MDLAASERLWGESFLGRLLTQVFEERLLLFAGQEFVVAGDRVEQDLRVAVVQMRSRQEIRADHLQTIAAGFVCAEHQSRRSDCLLNNGDLALVELEVDDLGRFAVLAGVKRTHTSKLLNNAR